MIQRIQSFWLVLSVCCMAMGLMFPVAKYHLEMAGTGQQVEAELNLIGKDNPEMLDQIAHLDPVVEYSQTASGFHTWPLVALTVLVGVIVLISLFMYTNRVLQMRVVAVGFLLNVVEVFLLFFWAVDAYGKTVAQAMQGTGLTVTWFLGAYAPIVSLVLLILAHRSIKRDEAKVRAADRLR